MLNVVSIIVRIVSIIISLYMVLSILSGLGARDKVLQVASSQISRPKISVVESADYVIETDGITTYVKNKNGIIVYSSMDSASAIQYAIDSLPQGKVLVRVGTYNLSNPINIQKSNVVVEGESHATVLRIARNNSYCIRIGLENSTQKVCENVIIRNLTLDGGYPTVDRSTGVSVSACDNILIEYVYFRNCGERNWIASWSEDEYRKKNVVIRNCVFDGVAVTFGGIDGGIVENNMFIGEMVSPRINTTVDLSYGEINNSLVTSLLFKNNIFLYSRRNRNIVVTWDGVLVGFQRTRNVIIADNIFIEPDGYGIRFRDWVAEGVTLLAEDIHITRNQINCNNNATYGIYVAFGDRIIVKDNLVRYATIQNIYISESVTNVIERDNM